MIVNFTGQPESGKTTLSKELRDRIRRTYPCHQVVILDGDVIRKVTNNYDYTEIGRRKNVSSAYDIATAILHATAIDTNFKVVVIIALISPFLDLREELKKRSDVLEFHLISSRCSRKKFNAPGYYAPETNYTMINTDEAIHVCVGRMMEKISESNLLPEYYD